MPLALGLGLSPSFGDGAASVVPAAFALTDAASDDTTGSSWTFAGLDIGAAAADRIVLVAVSVWMEYGGNIIDNVTIGGNDAAPVSLAFDCRRNHGDGFWTGWWALAVPAGTTADIVVTTAGPTTDSEGNSGVAVQVYSLTGADATPVGADCDTDRTVADAADTGGDDEAALSAEVNTAHGGVVLAVRSASILPTSGTMTWTGAVSDDETELFTNTARVGAASFAPSGAGLHTVTGDTDATNEVTGALALVSYAPTGKYALPSGIGRKWAKGGAISNFSNTATSDPFVLPVNLGPPAANRKVVLLIGGVMGTAAGLASVTVEGHAATKLVDQVSRAVSDGFNYVEAWLLDNQDLTAGRVTLTGNGTNYGFGVGAVPIYGLSATLADSASDSFGSFADGTGKDASLVLDVPANGLALACWCGSTTTLPVDNSWTAGLTEIGTTGIFIANYFPWGVYEAGGTLESGHTISAALDGVVDHDWAALAASFAPAA